METRERGGEREGGGWERERERGREGGERERGGKVGERETQCPRQRSRVRIDY